MKSVPNRYHRRSIRLDGYDYRHPGAYFITVVVQERLCLFGEIREGEMRLSPMGQIVRRAWEDLPDHYPQVVLDEFCIMPNHVHGIIVLGKDATGRGVGGHIGPPVRGAGRGGSTAVRQALGDESKIDSQASTAASQTRPYKMTRHGLPEIVRAFKSFSARQINALRRMPGAPVWQRNYYEHIVRNEAEWERIRRYIDQNLAQWEQDEENPERGIP